VKPRALLVLLLLVGGLFAFVWFYERKLPTTAERESNEKKVWSDLKSEDVREVKVERGGPPLRLVRQGAAAPGADRKAAEDTAPPAVESEWRVVAPPLDARADRDAVDGLLSSLTGLEKARTLEKVDRAALGLRPPQARVTLLTAKGERVLEVGRDIPASDQRAVAVAGQADVYAVDGSFWAQLTRPAGDWRSKQLFPGAQDEVERITLTGGANRVVLAKRAEQPWIEAPIADRADNDRFGDLMTALASLAAVEFVDRPPQPLAMLGLAPPQGTIEVVRKGQTKPFTIALGATKGEGEQAVRWALVDQQLVTVKAPPLGEALQRAPADWRSRAWTDLAVYEVDRIDVTSHTGSFVLTRADADWKRDGVKIFYGTISDLLAALSDARATKVVAGADAAAMTKGAPAFTLKLTAGGGRTQTLQLWPAAGDGAAARTSSRDVVLVMPAALPQDLAGKLAAVRGAKPMVEAAPGATPAKR